MSSNATVFVIDDDAAARDSIATLLRSVKLPVEEFSSAQDFLAAYAPQRPGCIVLDARLPGMGGLELQERLSRHVPPLQIIFLTGYGDVPMAVRAIQAGAVDFLEKPFRAQQLLDRVYGAIQRDSEARAVATRLDMLRQRAESLTPRESEVMEHVVIGLPNKAIALRLGVTAKAIEAYRARVMRKMQAESLADLVRMNVALEMGFGPLLLHERQNPVIAGRIYRCGTAPNAQLAMWRQTGPQTAPVTAESRTVPAISPAPRPANHADRTTGVAAAY